MHTAKPGDRRSLQPVRSFRAQDNLQTPAREGVGDNMKTVLLRSAFLSLAVLGTGISLQSQNNSEFAHLSGTLTDAHGGGIADVQVQARRDGSPSSQAWSAKSSAAGEYSLDLPAGRYRVRFTRSSFASREMVVDLAPGEPHVLSLRLGLAPLSANVVVTANTQPTELAHSPAPVDIIGAQEIEQRQAVFLPDGQGVNDPFINRGFAGNFGYSFSDSNQLRLTVRSDASFAGTPGQTLLGPAFTDSTAYDDLRQLSGNLSWNFKTGAHWAHRVSGMEARFLDTAGFPDFSFFETTQFNRAGFLAQSTYSFHRGAVTAGYQYEVENGDPNNLSGLHARRNNQAGFLDARWFPVPRLTLSAGARAEDNASFGTRVVPRVGGVYALRYSSGFWSDTRFKVSYGQGIEEPTMFESFSQDPCNPGNPALHPEQSRTLNVGLDQFLSSNRVRLSIGFFDNEFHNLINQLVGPPNPMCFGGNEMLYFNTDAARARGFNSSGEAHLLGWLTIKGNYSYDDSQVLQTIPSAPPVEQPGNHLIRRPVNSGNAWLNLNFRRVNLNFAGYFTGVRTDSDFDGLGITRNPGYARFDMATSYDVGKGLFFYARVSNLLDKQYQDAIGFPALGRDYRLGLKYRIGGRNEQP